MEETLSLWPATDREIVGSQANALRKAASSSSLNKIGNSDRPIHDWYRFVLSFPPHLVRQYLNKFDLRRDSAVLDPFCGTGTTVVEARKHGIRGIGIESNPVAHFASRTKSDWSQGGKHLLSVAAAVRDRAAVKLRNSPDKRRLTEEQERLLLKNSISPLPLHKVLVLRDEISEQSSERVTAYLQLALAKTIVSSASNLHFGPEVGVKGWKEDSDVLGSWFMNVVTMASDLDSVRELHVPEATVYKGDSRVLGSHLAPESIDAVFTSPPYPNEKDYTRTTRLESVILGFIKNKAELRASKKELIRSNTRGVYKCDDDDLLVAHNQRIQEIASRIEQRRIELNKTSGFERLYARVTQLYFGGMVRHLAELRSFLKQGAQLGYVVGDQASYLQVMIRTGEITAELAESLGYEVVGIDLFRTRLATATKTQMREEVVVLRWPGSKH